MYYSNLEKYKERLLRISLSGDGDVCDSVGIRMTLNFLEGELLSLKGLKNILSLTVSDLQCIT